MAHQQQQQLEIQLPQFFIGGLAQGGGAEVIPSLHGLNDYEKYWPGPSKYYSLQDPPVANQQQLPRPSSPPQTPRPFEFHDSPHSDPGNHILPFPSHHPPIPTPSASIPQFFLPTINSLDPTTPLPPIPPTGLPLYSASGFDMLRMLGKVATRPNPKIMLGPVDMTCSFVVVDVRRFDAPIVYASPTFTRLTGYSESEVLGRNCRFLQSPTGQVHRGEERRYTSPDAVRHLQKCLLSEKECQASLINYRRDGSAFINLVTVIPIAADDGSDDITHHVGFQVDLAEQPNAILQKLRDGSYIVNYSNLNAGPNGPFGFAHEPRRGRGVSQDMIALLSSDRTWPLGGELGAKPVRDHERAELHAMLLENTADFVHVVSLKGALLYVAPAVQRVLGYDPTELIGKSIADLCHPSDLVPLMRELKDASSLSSMANAPVTPAVNTAGEDSGSTSNSTSRSLLFTLPPPQPSQQPLKPVNLLFRIRHKSERYVWLEARGRLHVEQGKGRKAIVLVGRRTHVPRLRWAHVHCGGHGRRHGGGRENACRSSSSFCSCCCWGLVAPNGLVLSANGIGAERLGYGADGGALVGRSLASLVLPEEGRRVGEVLASAACAEGASEVRTVRCKLLVRSGAADAGTSASPSLPSMSAEMTFYAYEWSEEEGGGRPLPPCLVFRLRFLDDAEAGDDVDSRPAASACKSPSPLLTTHCDEDCHDGPADDEVGESGGDAEVDDDGKTSSRAASKQRKRRRHHSNVLEELDTARETCWQYELKSLHTENQRMRDELSKLERMQRAQIQAMPYLLRRQHTAGGGGPHHHGLGGRSSSSGGTPCLGEGSQALLPPLAPPPLQLVVPPLQPLPLPPLPSLPGMVLPSMAPKRTLDGEIKMPSPT